MSFASVGHQGNLVAHDNARVLRQLREGDLVEFDRGVFKHWAVYVGNGEVVHISEDDRVPIDQFVLNEQPNFLDTLFSASIGLNSNKAMVKMDSFWIVAGNSVAKKNNQRDSDTIPLDGEVIADRAKSMVGRKIDYSMLWKNCEHFVNWCRYGEEKSEQSEKVLIAAGLLAAGAAGAAGAVAVGLTWMFDAFAGNKKGNKHIRNLTYVID